MKNSSAIIDSARQIANNCTNDEQMLKQILSLLHDSKTTWNWIGVYLLSDKTLVLGPYIGKHTDHSHIEVGVGVCGTAVASEQNIIVADVRKLNNYLACSLETRSEIVVLIRHKGKIVGQFDIDSDDVGAFTPEDEKLLEDLSEIVSEGCSRLVTQTKTT